jgi:hypothetical protein
MNARTLGFVVLSLVCLSGDGWGQSPPIPMRDGNGQPYFITPWGPMPVRPADGRGNQSGTHRPGPKPAPKRPKVEARSERVYFASKFGVEFTLVRVGARYGAQVANVGSADSGVPVIWVRSTQRPLKEDDVIFDLDSRPILRAEEMDNHYSWTTLTIYEPSTGRIFMAVTDLGPATVQPGSDGSSLQASPPAQ